MEKLVLIDGNSLINRAFYTMPVLSTKDGTYTNAVYGFMNMFFKMLAEEKPTFVGGLVANNNLPKVKLFKAGHHGSSSSSHDVLLDVIEPEIVIITAVVGSFEYATNKPGNVNINGTFPTRATLERIAKHTSQVYATSKGILQEKDDGTFEDIGFESMNGDIVVISNYKGVSVTGSNNNTLLKDTTWAQTYRSGIAWAN